MNRLIPIALFVTLSGSAWGACTIYTTNPPIAGPCDDALVFPVAGIKDPSTPPAMIPVQPFGPPSGDTPLMLQNGTLLSISQTPCCVNFQTKAGTITMDLDNGTVDLHGAKLDDAARAFWDAVAQVAGHPSVKQRAYTLGDIDRMRVAIIKIGNRCIATKPGEIGCAGLTARETEDELRTYLAAGITPEELEVRAK